MRANRQVHERLDERLSPRLNVIRRNRMREIKSSCIWGNAEDHARENPGGGVAQAEVGHEGDQSWLRV
jgi:hypothetical protein